MMKINSFYKYISEYVSNESKSYKEDLRANLLHFLNFFPHFPDIELITDLSRENYERKNCAATLVFLPFQVEVGNNLASFSFSNKEICFSNENIRLIRKILESLDNHHFLLLEFDSKESKYFIRFICKKSNINQLTFDYYYIDITGYLKWKAHCKNFRLLGYNEGKFCDFVDNNTFLKTLISSALSKFQESFSKSNKESKQKLKKILTLILKQEHGTSFIVFSSEQNAKDETERLCNAGRGFKSENLLSYNELLQCIPQFTKVDGGLILDKNFNCYAYGVIYDGYVDNSYSGSLERGSRYNSTKLYVHTLNNKHFTCVGFVFSDDGGIEYVDE